MNKEQWMWMQASVALMAAAAATMALHSMEVARDAADSIDKTR